MVISRNEGKYLRRTIENLEDTLPGDAEIIVVDDGSKDRSADHLARRRGRVRLHRVQGLGVAKARNFGAKRSSGEALVFADAHLGLDRLWWKPLLEQIEDPEVGAAAPAITKLPASAIVGYGLTFKGPRMDVRWRRRKPGGPAPVPILRAVAWRCGAMSSSEPAADGTMACSREGTSTTRSRSGFGCSVTNCASCPILWSGTAFASSRPSRSAGRNIFITACDWRSFTSILIGWVKLSPVCAIIRTSEKLSRC